jgi:hypothetical protein
MASLQLVLVLGKAVVFIKVVPWRPFLSAENGVVVLLVVIGKLGYLFFRF